MRHDVLTLLLELRTVVPAHYRGRIDAILDCDTDAALVARIGSDKWATIPPRQRDVLRCLHEHRAEHGIVPTLQDIGDRLGISKVTAMEHLNALERRGVLDRGEKGFSRRVRIVRQRTRRSAGKA